MATLLIVEDEAQLRRALVDALRHEHYTVAEAVNGEEGLRQALANHPDLILLDIVMPIMDGLTMLKQLRLDDWGRQARVIILTNLSDAAPVADAFDQGTYDFLVKADWSIAQLVDKVKQRLALPTSTA